MTRSRLGSAGPLPEGLEPIPAQLRQRADEHPDRVLLHHRGRNWTYGEILAGAERVAAALVVRDVQPGDRVSIAIPNGAAYVMSYFGVQLAGACVVTLDVGQPGNELTYAIDHSGSAAAILAGTPYERITATGVAMPALRSMLLTESVKSASLVPTTPLDEAMGESGMPSRVPSLDASAQIIYTSGTTGRPKGVVLSHRNLAANTSAIIESLSLQSDDAIFAILPFSYSYGNSLLLTHVSRGARIIVASDFVFWNDALDLMGREKASGFAGIPSSYAMLINRSDFLRRSWPNLRYVTCAGGALPLPTVELIRRQLPRVSLYLMYGQTEASARLSCLPADDVEQKFGSAGRAIPGVELTIRDETGAEMPRGEIGEIVARGDNIMTGYWRDPEATARVLRADGLHTGDLARMDADGYVFISGRHDDMIKSGGYRIGPQEIEDAMLQVEGVAEVGVTGIADDMLGAVPVAFVVARGEDSSLVVRLRAHLLSTLPRYKVPREIHLVPSLPRTSNGKLQRRKLRDLVTLRDAGR